VLPIGVKVDGNTADTATVDQDTAAWRGDSRPIQPGQTGEKQISVVATDSTQPPKKTESVRTVELPAANPVQFAYDLNGNMTSDGTWDYAWDAENRLLSVQSGAAVPPADRLRLTFTYDADWRRRTKSVYAWDAQAETWILQRSHVFLYDEWNLIHELITDQTQTPPVTTAATYSWGLDLSQSLHGAGGIGGLLSATHSTGSGHASFYYAYDGNGNVMALVSAADGSLAASYDYSPFGETVKASGTAAEGNPWRFSTKYQDGQIRLVYYGARYYSPGLGRWLSRDPIGEEGGACLYAVCLNSPLYLHDALGERPRPGRRPPVGWPDPGDGWTWDPGSGRYKKGGRYRHWDTTPGHLPHWDEEDKNGNKHKNVYPFSTSLPVMADACGKCLAATAEAIADAAKAAAPSVLIGTGVAIVILDVLTVPSGEGACGVLLIKAAVEVTP